MTRVKCYGPWLRAFQADRDLVVIEGSMGTVLDPSADDAGITSKMGIDATRPFGVSRSRTSW